MRPLLVFAALLVAGCASTALPPPPATVDTTRPADGLLARPDLQALVDAQVRRDGAALATALASPDSTVRARAAFALASVQDEAAITGLRRLLDDPVPAVRADAAFALGQTADSSAGVALVITLRQEATASVLAELVEALGKVGGQADLRAVLETPLPDILEPHRALALARFGLRDVTSDAWAAFLSARLQDPDPAIRANAAYAFTRSPVAAWRAQAAAIRVAFDALAGDPARASLARALGRLDEREDTARLAEALRTDTRWQTRVQIARALDGRDDVPSRGALARAVDDPNPHVAQVAAEGLAMTGGPEALDLARAALDGDRPWTVQAALLPAVAQADPAAVLAWADRQPDPFAKAAALRALARTDDGTALTRLFTDARSPDSRLATAALGALGERWQAGGYGPRRFYDAYADALRTGDAARASTAAPLVADSAFWALGAGTLLREVYGTLDAPNDLAAMRAIVGATGKVRDGAEMDFLIGVALTGPEELRTAARDALNERLSDGVDVEVPAAGSPATTAIDWAHLSVVGAHPRLILDTDRGRVVIELDTEAAPQTVQRITTTAAQDLYDGVPFHRVVADFVVQGGDYVRRDGYGGPETPIRSEFARIRYAAGTIGMASSGKDTEGSQFFVTHSPQPHLDGRYTAFGHVVEGQDVVDAILQGDLVRRARVEPDRRR
ncbi:peptidylprolyl isomerase [Rubrivirga sp. IMCC45206]|uniref:peptidylprolyl isomerase n=1 Tax=Rubrivirga sp. IMCC45206 TaxID=3391614 RepID=UPI0039901370